MGDGLLMGTMSKGGGDGVSDENRILEKITCYTCQSHTVLYEIQYDGAKYITCERCAEHYCGVEVTA